MVLLSLVSLRDGYISDVPMVECDKAEKSFAIHYYANLRSADSDTRRT
jgi:hypothetical protein